MNPRAPTSYLVGNEVDLYLPHSIHHIAPVNEDKPSSQSDAKDNDLLEAGVGGHTVGKHLLTRNMIPCQCVIVHFTNGEFGLYHAFDPFTRRFDDQGTLFEEKSGNISKYIAFKETCKNQEIDEIIILEKIKGNAKNKLFAPLLAVGLAEHFTISPEKVKRLQVDDYIDVFCNGNKGEVIICQAINIKTSDSALETQVIVTPQNLRKLDLEIRPNTLSPDKPGYLIPHEQSILDLKKQQENGIFVDYKIGNRTALSEKDLLLREKRMEVESALDKLSDNHLGSKSPMRKYINDFKNLLRTSTSEMDMGNKLLELANALSEVDVGGCFKRKHRSESLIAGVRSISSRLLGNEIAPLIDRASKKHP